jgi:3',5'-cyclic AMP phosphodiesterase CpdA
LATPDLASSGFPAVEKRWPEIDPILFIKTQYPKHYLIVTGDISDDGHEQQFSNAFEALKASKGRIFLCPGNHDIGAAGNF